MPHGTSPTTDRREMLDRGTLVWDSGRFGAYRRREPAVHGNGVRRLIKRRKALVREGQYLSWWYQNLLPDGGAPLTYRQWCHPDQRARIL